MASTPNTTAAFGAGTGAHVRPPSPVRSIAGQRAEPHATLPSTQPSSAETNVTDIGAKPTGAGSDDGLADGGPADG